MIISIGHQNFIDTGEVLVILNEDNRWARGLRQEAEKEGKLIDSTCGRKTRSVIVVRSNHVVLSSLEPAAIKKRFDRIMKILDRDKKESQSSFFDMPHDRKLLSGRKVSSQSVADRTES